MKHTTRRKIRNATFKAMLEHLNQFNILLARDSGLRKQTQQAIRADLKPLYEGVQGLIR